MISLKTISTVATNKKTYERGFEYYNQRRVLNLKSETDKISGNTHISADVQGSQFLYQVEITLSADGKLLDHFCDCPSFYSYEGCCKHIVATLLQYYYKSVTQPQTPTTIRNASLTDSIAKRMINQYSNKIVNKAVSSATEQKIKLEPIIHIDSHGKINLELNAGVLDGERMYVIKDLSKFYSDMNEGNIVEYGVKLKFLHDQSAFCQDSLPLLKFFMARYREVSSFVGFQTINKGDKRGIFLSPHAFDDFFNIYQGKEVSFNFSGTKQPITFVDSNPPLKASVKSSRGSYIVHTHLPDMLISGESRQYLLINCSMYRCSDECTSATSPYLQAMMSKGGRLTIGEDDMGDFCASVLSQIRSFIEVKSNEDELNKFLPQALTSKLFLDMPQSGLVTANLKFSYGDLEFDSMSASKVNIRRNIKEELCARALVKKYFDTYDAENGFLYVESDDKIYRLLTEGIDEMSSSIDIYTTDKFKSIKIRKPPQVNIAVRLSSNLIDLDINTNDFPQDELASLLASYRNRKKFHKLRDGSFIGLIDSPLANLSELASGLDLSDEALALGHATVPKYRALYLDNVFKDSSQIKTTRDPAFKALIRDINDAGDSEINPPESLRNTLRNYQKTGFRWLKMMSKYGFGGVLADDMGLGKTLETITFLLSSKESSETPRVSLVVCPTSLVLNWESEINHFAPMLKALTIIGDAATREDLISKVKDYDIVITSYDLLKRDIELYKPYNFYCHIIDEAQYIKNAVTQNARAVKAINSEQRFALTGTPIENSLAEIWSLFDFLMPDYLHNHSRFKKEFELPVIKDDDEKALETLKKMLTPFILRRLKSNVLKELPPKTETILYAGLEGEQKKLYSANLEVIRSQLGMQSKNNNNYSNKVIILAMLTRLRQLCCDPSLCYDNYKGESAKLELCMELLDSSAKAGHKVLLFSQFTSMLSIIEKELQKRKISYFVLKGSTPKEDRIDLANRFNKDDTNVFLISLKAGGTGLNLTGADIVIHYDPWWNISAQNQATDRAHRIGQQNSVQVYKLIAKNSIEEKIIKLQQDKLKLADSVISDGDGLISKMSAQEIFNLFE